MSKKAAENEAFTEEPKNGTHLENMNAAIKIYLEKSRLFRGRDSFIWSVAKLLLPEPQQHLSGAFEFLQHWKGCD